MFSANTSQVSNDVKYIEDFFSAWLRTGTGSSQTVTTGIKENTGALVISKSRSAATDWAWYDTFRGATKDLASNTTAAETTQSQGLTSFNTDGHTWGTLAKVNTNGATYVDFVLKPTPKFFDVVTYTGDGSTTRSIAHALGSTPGCIIVKRTDASGYNWYVYHRSLGTNGSYPNYMYLNTTDSEGGGFYAFFSAAPTSTDFSVGYYSGAGGAASLNVNGATYVAYVFAHNAGGFGLTGTDNVISCGSFTTDGGGNATVNLGYEPQWILWKDATNNDTVGWGIYDVMRGWNNTDAASRLLANSSAAESQNNTATPTATGFTINLPGASDTYIYIAIRRGPMKTPTSGTSVFNAFAGADTSAITTNFPVDFFIENARVLNSANSATGARLLGGDVALVTSSTAATQTGFFSTTWYQSNTSYLPGCFGTAVAYAYRRAPSFFDVVCYTGTGSATTQTHNLGVAPELIIVKKRSTTGTWPVYTQSVGATQYLTLNSTNSVSSGVNTVYWNDTSPTASVFSVGTSAEVNASGSTYVAYLFASVAGVSKVGSYTGNGGAAGTTGTGQTINCGFTNGARFVMIKRTDSAGNWCVWDSARGIVAANDPTLALNLTSAEATSYDFIDADSSGFTINQVSAPGSGLAGNMNVTGATYIYLAIA